MEEIFVSSEGATYVISRKFVGSKRPKEIIIEKLLGTNMEKNLFDGEPGAVV